MCPEHLMEGRRWNRLCATLADLTTSCFLFSLTVTAPGGGGVQRAGEEHAAHGRHQCPGVKLRAEDHRARGQAFLRLRVGLHVLFLHPHAHDCAHSHHAVVQHLLSP